MRAGGKEAGLNNDSIIAGTYSKKASAAVINMADDSTNSHGSVSPTEETPGVRPTSSSGKRSASKKKKASLLGVFQLRCQRHN